MHDALNCGRIDAEQLRWALAALPLPLAADGQIVLAVDVSPWLRPDADTSPDRAFCHTYGRSEKAKHQMLALSALEKRLARPTPRAGLRRARFLDDRWERTESACRLEGTGRSWRDDRGSGVGEGRHHGTGRR
ncbi:MULTISPECIES: transposase [Actinomadura]|uniref:Transposase n=1 Tax=Actinomadura yumaensis TaxID=111807 RepID=A0ABW2CCZ7_9ACTN|nr:transposase [Actinomadura sp. J1-007]